MAVCDSEFWVDDALSDGCEGSAPPGDDVPEVDGFRACEVFGTPPGAAVGVVSRIDDAVSGGDDACGGTGEVSGSLGEDVGRGAGFGGG
jgi:hypothetical protein